MHNDELQFVWKVPHNPPRMLQTDKLPDVQLSQRCSHLFMISQSSTFLFPIEAVRMKLVSHTLLLNLGLICVK